MRIRSIQKLLGMRNFVLYHKYLLQNKVPEPYQSFKLLYQLAVQRSSSSSLIRLTLVMKRKFVTNIYFNQGKIEKYLCIRSYHYPIQYILGRWQFMSLEMRVKPPVLIPRFETEQMVAILLQNQFFRERVKTRQQNNQPFTFLQLGCGSGAISLSLNQYFQQHNIQYSSQMVDIQPQAISLTKLNMRLNKINSQTVNIYEADMISLLENCSQDYLQSFDLIISNPPYISQNQYHNRLQRQVRRYEAKLALVGDQGRNKDGLFYVQTIITGIQRKCTTKKPMVVIQYGGQSLSHLGDHIQSFVVLDYYGKRRFVFLMDW